MGLINGKCDASSIEDNGNNSNVVAVVANNVKQFDPVSPTTTIVPNRLMEKQSWSYEEIVEGANTSIYEKIGCYESDEQKDALIEVKGDLLKVFETLEAPRPRSWEVDAEKPFLYLRGRCGAGNKDFFYFEILDMKKCNHFYTSFENEIDPTYMYFVYSFPKDEWVAFLEKYKDRIK